MLLHGALLSNLGINYQIKLCIYKYIAIRSFFKNVYGLKSFYMKGLYNILYWLINLLLYGLFANVSKLVNKSTKLVIHSRNIWIYYLNINLTQ